MNRLRAITIGGALLVTLVLGVFAYIILDTQSQDREDVEQRFNDVADVSAALTEGVFRFAISGDQRDAAMHLSSRLVEPAALAALSEPDEGEYGEVLDASGERLVATPNAPERERNSAVERTLATGEPRFSDVIGEGGKSVVETAIPYRAATGQRVYITGRPASDFAAFLSGFLGGIPNFADAESVVIDSEGVIVGGSRLSTPVGEVLEDEELLEQALGRDAGDYGDDRYFASSEIASSPFRVVLAASKNDLYDGIGGSHRAIPWILFVAFAVAAFVGLYLLRRAARASAEVERRELNERHAVEINDNIIQGLALAKYQLQVGQDDASAAQVAETLREAQRLVSGLLGDAEVQAGQLRREGAAETTRPGRPADEPRR